ncbi:MAG: hypothetical protein ACFB15_21335 [Cyclobacteriaceae bacterium]
MTKDSPAYHCISFNIQKPTVITLISSLRHPWQAKRDQGSRESTAPDPVPQRPDNAFHYVTAVSGMTGWGMVGDHGALFAKITTPESNNGWPVVTNYPLSITSYSLRLAPRSLLITLR